MSNSILPVPRVVDDLFAEHCLADPIVVSIPERITGLKLSPGCFIDIIDISSSRGWKERGCRKEPIGNLPVHKEEAAAVRSPDQTFAE